MQIFTFCMVYTGNLHVLAKFCLDRLNGCGDIANFRFPIWRPSAILNFWNMQIFTVYNGNLHVPAKFRRDRLNTLGVITIKYFQYGSHPPSCIRCTHARDHPRGRIGGPKKLWKFRPNLLSSFCDIAIFPFWSFGWRVSIHAPILEVFLGYDPLKVVIYYRDPQKAPMVT